MHQTNDRRRKTDERSDNHKTAYIPRGTARSVSLACDAFFLSRGMPTTAYSGYYPKTSKHQKSRREEAPML